MDFQHLIASLESSGTAVVAAVTGLSDDAVRWRPEPGRWSMLEVLAHLRDEEREDFRRRLGLMLENPTADWPRIDPAGWVSQRDYNNLDPRAVVAEFKHERVASIQWLVGLVETDWSQSKPHPAEGAFHAGDLLAAWAAHDLVHLRQIANLRLAYVEHISRPYSIGYATA